MTREPQDELVFLPRLVPHLYPGTPYFRARARRGRRGSWSHETSPYARTSRKSSLSQVLDLRSLRQGSSRRRTLDEYAGFEIITLCAASSEDDYDNSPKCHRKLSFGSKDKDPFVYEGIGTMERVELITMSQSPPIQCFTDTLSDEDDEEDFSQYYIGQ